MSFAYRVQLALGTLAAWLMIAAVCWLIGYIGKKVVH